VKKKNSRHLPLLHPLPLPTVPAPIIILIFLFQFLPFKVGVVLLEMTLNFNY